VAAVGDKEDLAGRAQADNDTAVFLRASLEKVRHELGLGHVARGECMSKRDHIRKVKEDMDAQMESLERRMASEKQRREKAMQQSEDDLKRMDHRIQVLRNVSSFAEEQAALVNGGALEGVAVASGPVITTMQLKSQVATMKEQKKVLVKGVKQLQRELKSLHDERDQFLAQLAELKKRLDAL